jgi:hypothetical protein
MHTHTHTFRQQGYAPLGLNGPWAEKLQVKNAQVMEFTVEEQASIFTHACTVLGNLPSHQCSCTLHVQR